MCQLSRDALNATPAGAVNLDRTYIPPSGSGKGEPSSWVHRNGGQCHPSACSALNGLSGVETQKATPVTRPLILKTQNEGMTGKGNSQPAKTATVQWNMELVRGSFRKNKAHYSWENLCGGLVLFPLVFLWWKSVHQRGCVAWIPWAVSLVRSLWAPFWIHHGLSLWAWVPCGCFQNIFMASPGAWVWPAEGLGVTLAMPEESRDSWISAQEPVGK